jgi:lipopolysaccharide exporter
MRYHVMGVARTCADLTYSISSVVLAVLGFGGMAIVYANIARSTVKMLIVTLSVERAAWLTPSGFSWPIVRDMMRFGVPLWLSGMAEFASRKWDNLAFAAIYGPAVMGEYNLAYNLAEIPANQIGEQIGDVLLPTFANLDIDQKRRAIVRSLGLISLIVFPLAIGLGSVAPTAVHSLLRKEWQGVWPMLAILSAMAIARPFGWTISSYLQARDQTRPTLWLETSKVAMIVGFIWLLSLWSPLWSCVGVGLAFTGNALFSMWVVQRLDGVRVSAFLARCARPLAACIPLCAGVLGVRWLLGRAGFEVRGVNLLIEVVAGGVGYSLGVAVFAREMARDVEKLVRNAVARRRGG